MTGSTQSFSNRVADFTVARRNFLFLMATIITLLTATGILRISFDTSLAALLSENDPYLDELDILRQDFPARSEVHFLFVAEPGNTVFTPEILGAINDLTERYADIPFARRITTLLEYTSPETQRRLFSKPPANYSATELEAVRRTAVNERLLTSNLLSSDASLTSAIITLFAGDGGNGERLEIAAGITEVRDTLRAAHPDVALYTNADVLLEQASQQDMVDDLTSLLPIVILMCVVVICYCFKSMTLGACILTHVACTMLMTVGLLGYLGFAFNTISITAPLVVVIIAVANSVHLISIYKQALHREMNKVDAMRHSMAYNFQPITLAALTTAIGFTSLNLCSSPAVQDFGRIVAVGIVIAYLLTLTIVPLLLIRFSKLPRKKDMAAAPFLQDSLNRVISFTNRRDRAIFLSCSALALVTLLLLPLNETDFDRLDYIAPDAEIKTYYDVISERMNRGPALVYGLDTAIENGAINPAFLSRVDEFTTWLERQENIESVLSVAEMLKTINQIVNDNDENYFLLPGDDTTNSNYLRAYRLVEGNYLPLSDFINDDYSHLTVFINAEPMSNQDILDLDAAVTAKFSEIFDSTQLVHGSGVLLFARMDELVTVELLQGYSLSLLLITLCLVVGFRSLYFGILSVLPNLLPATIVFGIWALFVGQVDPFVMMLFSISIGLVVDDTVHILSHYLEGRRAGADKEGSIAHSIRIAGPALTITTLVLAFGTTVLIFANTLYFQQSAKLLVPIVILALVLDLTYLPTILKRFDNKFQTNSVVTS